MKIKDFLKKYFIVIIGATVMAGIVFALTYG
jgi:hypothetical protein